MELREAAVRLTVVEVAALACRQRLPHWPQHQEAGTRPEEGTLVIDGSCPEDLVVGRCHFDERREVWSVYPCNRWDDLPDGEAAGCEGAGGRWEPADD